MPDRKVRFESTPNPNALKCVLDRPIPGQPRSYRSPDAPASDTLAHALFAVPGVTSLLIYPDWITVNKSPDSPWPAIKSAVERLLSQWP